jgi:hypothetical protein
LAFLPNPKRYDQINHKDGNKTNNFPDNLEWCDIKMNIAHSNSTGLAKVARGENHGHAKLTEKEVRKIKSLIAKGKGCKELATMFGVGASCISSIKLGRLWAHV